MIIDSQVHIWAAETPDKPWSTIDASKPHRGARHGLRARGRAEAGRDRRAVEAFGPERVFWGTDFSHLPCPYRQALTLFTEELAFLSAADKEWIMGRAIAEWLNWPLPEQP